jgi:hypothetical protein
MRTVFFSFITANLATRASPHAVNGYLTIITSIVESTACGLAQRYLGQKTDLLDFKA